MVPPRRHQTSTERDLDGLTAKRRRDLDQRDRELEARELDAAPSDEISDEPSQAIRDPDLRRARRRSRKPSVRFDHIETAIDELRERNRFTLLKQAITLAGTIALAYLAARVGAHP